MTKAALIKTLAKTEGMKLDDARNAVETLTKIISKQITKGRFELEGIGVFKVVDRAARVGRNLQDGSPVDIPAKKAVKFKVSADLDRRVNTW